MDQQVIFKLSNKNIYDENEFIPSNASKNAHDLICLWPNKWGVAPIENSTIIIGPSFSGKTFLAKIWSKKSKAVFLTEELNLDEIKDFPAIIIDDFNLWLDENKLFHLMNLSKEYQIPLLLTATHIPKINLPDLDSRIKAIYTVKISQPDDDLIKLLIFKFLSKHSVTAKKEVINYLLKILPREFSKIYEFIDKINNYALTHKKKITIPLIKKVLYPIKG